RRDEPRGWERRPTLSQRHSRGRPRNANLSRVRHFKHKFIRIGVINNIGDPSARRALLSRRTLLSRRALLSRRTLLSLRPLRPLWTFRTDKVHEQGPGPIVIPKQVPCARVQIH